MSTTATRPLELERAVSDYLAISRQAHLFAEGEYASSEERAWERLAAAIAAARDAGEHDAGERDDEEHACTVSS